MALDGARGRKRDFPRLHDSRPDRHMKTAESYFLEIEVEEKRYNIMGCSREG